MQIETPTLQFLKRQAIAPIPGEEAARLAAHDGCDANGVDYRAQNPPLDEVVRDGIADNPPPSNDYCGVSRHGTARRPR